MKRPLTIAATVLLTVLVLYACSGTIGTSKTSIVTITIGGSQGTAVLKAEAATPWVKLRNYLAGVKWITEAYAYIPSVVQVLTVTVTAPDIATPIVGVSSLSSNQTIATLTIEVPNGTDRHFLVEGWRALPGGTTQIVFSGTNRTDLTGVAVNLQINMLFTGTGIYVNPSLNPGTADVPGCGTFASPCATITYVLNTRPSTTNNDIILALAGTYKVGSVAAQEIFPLALKPGMALLCMGTGFSSVIDAATFGTLAIRGNDNASVDNCLIRVGQQGTGVTDMADPQLLITAATKINGSVFEVPTGATTPSVGVVLAHDLSLLLDSKITGTNASFQAFGVQVAGGKPSIIGNTISNLPIGLEVAASTGDAEITDNLFDSNFTTGIVLNGAGKALVSANTFTQQFAPNATGITINSGSPIIRNNTIAGYTVGIAIGDADPEVRGNIVTRNWRGIDISTAVGAPLVNGNTIYCNDSDDVVVNDPQGTLVFDLRNNSWDHDTTTAPYPGPTIFTGSFSNNQGDDIFVTTPTPTPLYIPFSPAVPNGCLPPVGVGKPAT